MTPRTMVSMRSDTRMAEAVCEVFRNIIFADDVAADGIIDIMIDIAR